MHVALCERNANMDVLCHKCGTKSRMVAEENSVTVADGHVVSAGRDFICPQCVRIFQNFGHHSTLLVADLKAKFPKERLRKLRAALPPAERLKFNKALTGKRTPKDGEIEHWLDVLAELP